MSAWIVSKTHIDTIIEAAIQRGFLSPEKATKAGRLLWRECLRSVAYRYPSDTGEGDRPGPVYFRDNHVEEYTYTPTNKKLSDGALYKTLACYRYQSCEHPGWERSRAARFVERIVQELVVPDKDAAMDDAAPWGWDDPDEVALAYGWQPETAS